ncbi:MAG TPA: hypothetical protein VID75_05445, partial [Acidimicrobiales bacterium]
MLDRIRRELGPDAKINGAEKIRVGGVLGFFAKEHYRVMVEAPDAEPAGLIAAEPAAANGRDVFRTMAEATDDVNDVGLSPPPHTSPAHPPLDPAPPPPFTAPFPEVTHLGGSPAAASPVGETTGSTGDTADSFDTVLSRVAHTLGDPPSDVGNGHVDTGAGPIDTGHANTGNGHVDAVHGPGAAAPGA